jgi:CheY-like chemotaxis protein
MASIRVVDDDAESRQHLTKLLAPRGDQLLRPSDGSETSLLVRATQPDFVLTLTHDAERPNASNIKRIKESSSSKTTSFGLNCKIP